MKFSLTKQIRLHTQHNTAADLLPMYKWAVLSYRSIQLKHIMYFV